MKKKKQETEAAVSAAELDKKAREISEYVMESVEIAEIQTKDFCEQLAVSNLLPEEERDTLYDTVDQEIELLRYSEKQMKGVYKRLKNTRADLATHLREVNRKKKNVLYRWIPTNIEVDYVERKKKHFMQGINFYKLAYICFLGSFFGVFLEMAYAFVQEGVIESRAGLIYGPFNFLYGIGAVALSIALYPIRNQRGFVAFFGGMVIGSAVEYVCSYVQELLFGIAAWDYSDYFLNINGRICLFYSVLWGVLGYIWIKILYPIIAQAFLKIPSKFGKVLAWLLIIFLAINGIMTSISLFRWGERKADVPPPNAFWEFIDERFPDERMEKVFPKMWFSQNS